MSLLGRDPFRLGLDEFWGDADPWGDSSFFYPSNTSASSGGGGRQQRRPTNRLMSMDAFETDSEFKVIVECPGIPKEKLDVNVDNYMLTVRCTKPAPDYTDSFNMIRNELVYGTDSRSVRVPTNCTQEPTCCQYKDGCLCITFPKSEHHEGKKLQIQSST